MAAKLQFTRPVDGMNFIWNVSQHVGDNISCPNQPTDVDLVKILIGESIRVRQISWVNQALRIPFQINGQMDMTIAYFIRAVNADERSPLSLKESGIISPARGASYGGNYWAIFKLNYVLKQNAPNVWQNLPSHQNVSSALRRELQ